MRRKPSEFHDYQYEAVVFMLMVRFAGVWLDMGLGKTVCVLTVLMFLLQDGEAERVLIVAPLKVAVNTWPNEIDAWEHTYQLPFTVIRPTGDEPEVTSGKRLAKRTALALGLPNAAAILIANRAQTNLEERERRRLARVETPIHIINRERLPWLVAFWGNRWPYDTVVFDEASGLKNHKSDRFLALNKVRKRLKRLIELTGTPMPEGYQDLFAPIYLLDLGAALGRNITAYRNRYFTYDSYKRRYTLIPGSADQIVDLVKPNIIAMRAEDYLQTEKPVFVSRTVSLTEAQQEQYDDFEKSLVLSLPDAEIEAPTASSLAGKLLQFASGAVYDNESKWHAVHEHKFEMLREIVDEAQGAPVLIAYWFKPTLARLKKLFPDGVKLDAAGSQEAAWTRGEISKMFIHPASAGHGLNLQYGGHYLIFIDTPYSNELYWQTVFRIARQGQVFVPRIFHIVTKGTLDTGIVPRLIQKQSVQEYAVNRIKRVRKLAA